MRRLGHYRFLRELGRRGMGQGYLAEDTKLGRRVALKILPTELATRTAARALFEREARATAALNHPGVVTVYSLEQDGGVHFLTMEHVAGMTLAEVLADGPLPVHRLMKFGARRAVETAERTQPAGRQPARQGLVRPWPCSPGRGRRRRRA